MKKETYYYQNNNYKIIKISKDEYYKIIDNKITLTNFLKDNICLGNNYGKNFYEISLHANKYILRKYIAQKSNELSITNHTTLLSTIKPLVDKIRIEPKKNYKKLLQTYIKYIQILLAVLLVTLIIQLIVFNLNISTKILLKLTAAFFILEIIESILTRKISLRAMEASYDENPFGYLSIIFMHIIVVVIIIFAISKI